MADIATVKRKFSHPKSKIPAELEESAPFEIEKRMRITKKSLLEINKPKFVPFTAWMNFKFKILTLHILRILMMMQLMRMPLRKLLKF